VTVDPISDRDQVKVRLKKDEYGAILLDIPNPSIKDLEYWNELTGFTTRPVLILGTNNSEVDRVLSYQQAVLYLAEPFAQLFQMFSNLKEIQEPDRRIIELAPGVRLDVAGLNIRKNNVVISLSAAEFKLLYLLADNIGQTFTARDLIDQTNLASLSTLYVHIRNIRCKIEEDPRRPVILVQERGKGYKILRHFGVMMMGGYLKKILDLILMFM
jgi:DNA-binding response OmpR family regulator